jgi:site-specific recombinase XerD
LERTLRIDGRKTGRERMAAVPDAACRCLEAYLPRRQNHLEALGAVKETSLFVDRHGGRLMGGAISRAIHTLARRSGIEHLTLHQFRHTCASDLLENGVHLPEVQAVLGHQTITTTVRYLHIADPQRHAAVQLHPINEILRACGQTEALITRGGQA